MKKIFFLLAIFFGLNGNVWGQTMGPADWEVVVSPVTCFGGNDGVVTVKFINTYDPLYTVVLTGPASNPVEIQIQTDGQDDVVFSSGLMAGYYSVRLYRGGGTTSQIGAQKPATIASPSQVQFLSADSSLDPCEGGSISASVAGGAAPYTIILYKDEGVFVEEPDVSASVHFDNLYTGVYVMKAVDSKGCSSANTVPISIETIPPLVIEAVDSTDVTCYGDYSGTITVRATGGTPKYDFMIDETWDVVDLINEGENAFFNGLNVGTFHVVVYDMAGCTDVVAVTIQQPAAPLSAVFASTDVLGCFGETTGSISVTDIENAAGDEYTITLTPDPNNESPKTGTSATFGNLPAGAYTITVSDDNGCEVSDSPEITQPDEVTFTATPVPNECGGANAGEITISDPSYLSGMTYKLMQGDGTVIEDDTDVIPFTGLEAGVYKITGKYGLCESDTVTVILTDPQPVTVDYMTTPVGCNGEDTGSITLTADGGTGSDFEYNIRNDDETGWQGWQVSPLFDDMEAGNYWVIAKDGKGCESDSVKVTIEQPEPLVIDVPLKVQTTCSNTDDGAIAVTGVTGGTSPYMYSINGTDFFPNDETFTDLVPDIYTLTVKDANGCADSVYVEVERSLPVTLVDIFHSPDPACPNDNYHITLTVEASGETDRELLYALNPQQQLNIAWQPESQFEGMVGGVYNIWAKYSGEAYDVCDTLKTSYNIILQKPPIINNLASTPVSCHGGDDGVITVTMVPGSGTGTGYTYSIDDENYQPENIFSGLEPGDYTVYVKDDNAYCPDPVTQTITLANPAPIVVTNVQQTDISCPTTAPGDGTITAEAAIEGSVLPLNYSLQKDGGVFGTPQATGLFTDLDEGTYVVRVTDMAGCEKDTAGIIIRKPEPVTFTISGYETDLACEDATTDITVTVTSSTSDSLVYRLQGGEWQGYDTSGTNKIEGVGQGDHVVEVAYANGKTCPDTAIEELQIEPVIISFDLTAPPLDCSYDETSITISNIDPEGLDIEFMLTGPENRPYQQELIFDDLPGGDYMVTAKITATDGTTCTNEKDIDIVIPDPVSIDNVLTADLVCFDNEDGEIHIIASGSNPPFTYTIENESLPDGALSNDSGDFDHLLAGDYHIIVTDVKNCRPAEKDTVLIQPDKMTAVFEEEDVTHVACYSDDTGSAKVTIEGGVAPYQYTWEIEESEGVWTEIPTITGEEAIGLNAGKYRVTVVDFSGECSVTEEIEIEEPASELTITEDEIRHITCDGNTDGSISVKVSGGTPDYQYSILGQIGDPVPTEDTEFLFSGLTKGAYRIVVTDANGCTDITDPVQIKEPTPITGSFDGDSITCHGNNDGRLTFTASGGGIEGEPSPTYTYEWSHDSGLTAETATGLVAGRYSVTVSVGVACEKTFTHTLTEPDEIAVTRDSTHVTCFGAEDGTITLHITGGTEPYDVTWDGPDSYYSTDTEIIGLAPGEYVYSVTDGNSCPAATGSVVIEEPSKIAQIDLIAEPIECANETTTLTVRVTLEPEDETDRENLAFSLNSGVWQKTDSIFYDIPVGAHTVEVGYWVSESEATCVETSGVTITARPVITISSVAPVDPVIPCDQFTTQVTVTASGESGTDGLEYKFDSKSAPADQWQTSNEFAVSAGAYTVCVRYDTDPGCPVCFGDDIAITRDIDIEINDIKITGSPVNCADDETASILIIAEGDGAPLEYGLKKGSTTLWQLENGLFTNLGAGDYEILARYENDDECYQSAGVYSITAPDKVIMDVASANISCFGESNGQLSIRVTQGMLPFTVNVSALPSFDIQGHPLSPAYNGNFTVLDYSDVLEINDLYANTYSITVTDNNGCEISEEVTIFQPNRPLSLTVTPINICPGESFGDYEPHVDGGWPDYKLYWDYNTTSFNDSDFAPMVPNTSPTPKTLEPGYYRVVAEDVAMCRDTSKFEVVQIGEIVVEDYRTYGISCNNDNGSVRFVYPAGNVRDFVYRVRYQSDGGIVPGYGEYKPWENDSVFGLEKGVYMVDILDLQGLGCSPKTIQNIEIEEFRIENIDWSEPDCDHTGYIDFEVWGTNNPAVTINGIAVSPVVQDVQPLKFHEDLNKGGRVIIVATDESGCVKTWSEEIPFDTDLIFDKVEITPNFCSDDNIATIEVLAVDQTGSPHADFTYRLYEGNATIAENLVEEITTTNLGDPVVFGVTNGLPNGVYTLSMQADAGGCFTNDTILKIDHTNKVELQNVNVDIINCPQRIVFTIAGDPSNTSYSYSINGSIPPVIVLADDGNANVVIDRLMPGIYDVAIHHDGCTYTEQFDIASKVKPAVTSHDETDCAGAENGSIDIQMPDASGIPYQYWYYGPDHKSESYKPINSTSLFAKISDLGAGDYKVVVQQVGNCYSDTVQVTIAGAPEMNIDTIITPPACKGGNDGEIEIIVDGDPASYSVEAVEYPDGNEPEINGLILSKVAVGRYVIIVHKGKCAETLEIDIDAPQAIFIKASVPDDIGCSSYGSTLPVTVEVTDPPSGVFEYYVNTMLLPTNGERLQTFDLIKGNYHILVREEGSGCFADTTINVPDLPQPIELNVEVNISRDENCIETASIVVKSITGGDEDYAIMLDGTMPIDISEQIEIQQSGQYFVEVIDGNGCSAKWGEEEINLSQGVNDVIADIEDETCSQKADGRITLSSVNDYIYEWHDENHTTGNKLTGLTAEDYTVTITTTESDPALRCSVEKNYSVETKINLEVEIAAVGGDTHFFCPGGDVKLNGMVTMNGKPIDASSNVMANWTLDSHVWEFVTNNPLELTATNDGVVWLTASSGPCQADALFEINILPMPTVTFSTDEIYIPGDEAFELRVETPTNYLNYQWTSIPAGQAQNFPPPPATVMLPSPDAPYQLILNLTDENGCSSGDTVFVGRALDFFIPNAFTPNDDGSHDKWEFRNIEQYTGFYEIRVAVFNRGGMQVYEGKGYNNSSVVWDGRRNGLDLPVGTYYYVVELVPKSSSKGQKITYKGSVTIIR